LIEHRKATLLPAPAAPDLRTLAIAAAAVVSLERSADAPRAGAWRDPWSAGNGWRPGTLLLRAMRFGHHQAEHDITLEYAAGGWTVRAGDDAVCLADLRFDPASGLLRGLTGDSAFEVAVALDGESLHLFGPEGPLVLHWASPLAHAGDAAADAGGLTAPMPGKVVAVLVAADEKVARGQPLVVIEAMKMEHTIAAPADGRITELRYRTGDQVAEGAALIGFEAA
jgi:3-methylcrotonyl-CoA carboxylase alpha subunit